MNKKFVISLFVCLILLLSSVCFATNAGGEAEASGEKTETTLDNVGNGIRDFAEGIGNGVRDAAEGIGNGVQDFFEGDTANGDRQGDNAGMGTGDMGTATGMGTDGMGTDGYTATRTNADGTGSGMTNTAWIWLIMGIVGVVIVALTWYYVSQDTQNKS